MDPLYAFCICNEPLLASELAVTQVRLNQLLDMVPGALADEEAMLLFRGASLARGGCVMKVGACFNRPTMALAVGVAAQPEATRTRFYCVAPRRRSGEAGDDAIKDYQALRHATETLGCTPIADLVLLPSPADIAAWSEPIGVLCTRASDYELTRETIDTWLPFLSSEGAILFHDAAGEASAKIIAALESSGFNRGGQAANTVLLRRSTAQHRGRRSLSERSPALDVVGEFARAQNIDPKPVVNRFDLSSFVTVAHRYVYVEVPKAACTTLKYFITELEKAPCELQQKPYLRETRRSMLIHQRKYVDLPTLLDLNAVDLRRILSGQSGYFIFGLVRNPFSRLVSVFESKIRLLEPGFRAVGLRWAAAEPNSDVHGAFRNFVEAELQSLAVAEHHFTPQYELLFPQLVPYTKIFQLEQFAEFERAFVSHLQSLGVQDIPQFKERNRALYPDWRLYYDRATAAHVANFYAKDFEAFGYDPQSWRHGPEPQELRTSPTEAYWRREVMERNELIEFLYELLRKAP